VGDPLIELDIDRAEPPRRPPLAGRWIMASVTALLCLAVVAILVGRAQRPKPAPEPKPPAPANYVSSPGFSLYTTQQGDALFEIVIHSYSSNPIALSMPKVTTLPGVEQVRVMLTDDEKAVSKPRSDHPWPASDMMVLIPAYGDATLAVAYHVGCQSLGQHGPFVTAASIWATAGSNRSSRNVMPVLNPSVVYGTPYCPDR
jgi:hypothetical protein